MVGLLVNCESNRIFNFQNMKIFIFLVGCIMVALPSMMQGQVVLQLEKTGSVKRIRYYKGDIIEFKTKQLPETWQKRMITDILPDQNVFKSDNDIFNVNTITHIRQESGYGPIISTALFSIAVVSVLASAGFYIRGIRPDSWVLPIAIPVTAAIFGWLVKRFWKYKIYHVGSKRRLRTMDLNFYPLEEVRP